MAIYRFDFAFLRKQKCIDTEYDRILNKIPKSRMIGLNIKRFFDEFKNTHHSSHRLVNG